MKAKTIVKTAFGTGAILAALAGTGIAAGNLLLYVFSDRDADISGITNKEIEKDENGKKANLLRTEKAQWLKSMPLKHYEIKNKEGLTLKACCLEADEPSDKFVFAVHGYRSTGIYEFGSVAEFYHAQGYNVFMMDHRASGESDGKYITFGQKESEDCMLWLSFIRKQYGNDIKIILHGVSMGSSTVMLMCEKMLPQNVVFAICDCGYATLKSQLRQTAKIFHLPPSLSYSLYNHMAKKKAGFTPDMVAPINSVEKSNIPILFVHGDADELIPYDNVRALYAACKNPNKRLLTVHGAGHAESFIHSNDMKQEILNMASKLM